MRASSWLSLHEDSKLPRRPRVDAPPHVTPISQQLIFFVEAYGPIEQQNKQAQLSSDRIEKYKRLKSHVELRSFHPR